MKEIAYLVVSLRDGVCITITETKEMKSASWVHCLLLYALCRISFFIPR